MNTALYRDKNQPRLNAAPSVILPHPVAKLGSQEERLKNLMRVSLDELALRVQRFSNNTRPASPGCALGGLLIYGTNRDVKKQLEGGAE